MPDPNNDDRAVNLRPWSLDAGTLRHVWTSDRMQKTDRPFQNLPNRMLEFHWHRSGLDLLMVNFQIVEGPGQQPCPDLRVTGREITIAYQNGVAVKSAVWVTSIPVRNLEKCWLPN